MRSGGLDGSGISAFLFSASAAHFLPSHMRTASSGSAVSSASAGRYVHGTPLAHAPPMHVYTGASG